MSEQSLDEFRRRSQLLNGLDVKVFDGIVRGETNLNIARYLNVSLTAVKGCRDRLISFMGVKDGIEMIRLGRECRLERRELEDPERCLEQPTVTLQSFHRG